MQKIILNIERMHCQSCAKMIEDSLKDKRVVAEVDFENGKAKIMYNKEKIKKEDILNLKIFNEYNTKEAE